MTPLMQLQGVKKHFGGVAAVDDVTFDVPRQGVLGLIGPNGAGKTTVFNILTGHIHPDAGTVLLDGERVEHLRPSALARRGVARSWQHVRLLPELTVLQNVLVAIRLPHAERPFARLYRWRLSQVEEREARERALAALERVGLPRAVVDRPAHDLSYAEQKIAALARLLVTGPRLLLLDEPASGLDRASLDRLLELTRSVADEGTPVVVVEHNLSVVTQVADQAVVMSNGKVLAQGPPLELVRSRELIELYVGSRGAEL